MDAIGKWKNGVLIAVKNYGNACAHNAQSPATFELEQAQEDAYVAVCNELRTTPEGFALVPVPEWIPFDEFTSYPAPESSGWFWYIKDDEIFRGTAMQVCLARGVTYWCPADNPPAPPKAPPPKSEPL